jgi:hypothetical protein
VFLIRERWTRKRLDSKHGDRRRVGVETQNGKEVEALFWKASKERGIHERDAITLSLSLSLSLRWGDILSLAR